MLVIAGTTFGIFIPAVIVPYAFADDYSILWMVVSGKPSSPLIQNILDWDALIGLIGIVVLALLLHRALVRARIAPTFAAVIALLVCTMPAFQVFDSYTELFVAPYAALLAGGASLLAVDAITDPRGPVTNRSAGATGLLLGALMIYQPAAMFFWVFLAIAVVGARRDAGRASRLARMHLSVGVVALGLEFLATKLTIHFLAGNADFGSTAGAPYRTNLTHDIVGKTRWFFGQPLKRSLNLFDLTPSVWLAVLVGVVAVGGILLWLLYWSPRPLLYLGIGVSLVPLSYLPNLVVTENSATYRTQVALSSLIALYFCHTIGELSLSLPRPELRIAPVLVE